MIIDNEKRIISLKLRKLFFAILAGIVITLFFTLDFFRDSVFGLSNKAASVIVIIFYFGYYFYQWFLNPYYIHFSDEGEKIVLKFYASRASGGKKMAIEIPKHAFHHFEQEKEIINQKEKITLFQTTSKGIFKYPAIYLSGLNKKEKENLIYSLKKYIKEI